MVTIICTPEGDFNSFEQNQKRVVVTQEGVTTPYTQNDLLELRWRGCKNLGHLLKLYVKMPAD